MTLTQNMHFNCDVTLSFLLYVMYDYEYIHFIPNPKHNNNNNDVTSFHSFIPSSYLHTFVHSFIQLMYLIKLNNIRCGEKCMYM